MPIFLNQVPSRIYGLLFWLSGSQKFLLSVIIPKADLRHPMSIALTLTSLSQVWQDSTPRCSLLWTLWVWLAFVCTAYVLRTKRVLLFLLRVSLEKLSLTSGRRNLLKWQWLLFSVAKCEFATIMRIFSCASSAQNTVISEGTNWFRTTLQPTLLWYECKLLDVQMLHVVHTHTSESLFNLILN